MLCAVEGPGVSYLKRQAFAGEAVEVPSLWKAATGGAAPIKETAWKITKRLGQPAAYDPFFHARAINRPFPGKHVQGFSEVPGTSLRRVEA